MAIITLAFEDDADYRVTYDYRLRREGDPTYAEGAVNSSKAVIKAFQSVRKLHNDPGGRNEVIAITQSWSAEESAKLSKEDINKMGRELIEKYFEGHIFCVCTHTDKAHWHNHIAVNPIHTETGKRVPNKKKHYWALREINDQLCKARGLSVLNSRTTEPGEKSKKKIRRMQNYRQPSWVLDTMEKADFARKYSTSYSEYRALLLEFGIGVQVEPKNITYFYPGREKGKRGDMMGKKYDKKSLEETFRSNEEVFRKSPGLRNKLEPEMSLVRLLKGESLKQKNYAEYTKTKRGEKGYAYPHESELKDSPIPMSEVRRARMGNIFEYCKRYKIETFTDAKGATRLKEREHVSITSEEWINDRNKTRGTLIEFASAYHKCSFVRAIADINSNKRLLLLEQHVGEKPREYYSFYIPKQHHMGAKDAVAHLGRCLKFLGCDPNTAKSLFDKNRAQITKQGAIRFLPMGEPKGAMEFVEGADGKWSHKNRGRADSPFISIKGNSHRAVAFLDPVSAIKKHEADLFSTRSRRDGLLVLMEPDHKSLDIFLARERDVKELVVVLPKHRPPTKAELDFFSNLKKRYLEFGIDVRDTPTPSDRSREHSTLSR